MLAKIHRPAKTAMQSGKGNCKDWLLEFEPSGASRPDALMGWTSAPDARGQVRLRFESKEQAIAFARAHGLPHQVIEPSEPRRVLKAYGDNFAFRRREPWSH